MSSQLTRRDFLKLTTAATVAAASPSLGAAQAGLPRVTRQGPPREIVVIGAGLAGLCAGYELNRAGHRATLLEARSHPGGRILTLHHPFADDLYAEAGGTWIPDNHDYTLHYAEIFGLELEPATSHGLSRLYHVHGDRFPLRGSTPLNQVPLKLPQGDDQLTIKEVLERHYFPALQEVEELAAGDWSAAALAPYDAVSAMEYFAQRSGSRDVARLILMGLFDEWGEGPDSISALMVLRNGVLTDVGRTRTYRIVGGADLLPKAFARELKERIHYGARVHRLEQGERSVTVVFEQGGATRSMVADRVICTLPFSVLRHVEFAPELSAGKRKAIETLPYTSLTRTFLQVRQRYWEEEGLIGQALTDLPIGSIDHLTLDQPGPRGVLTCTTTAREADHLDSLDDEQRLAFTAALLERIFPGFAENVESMSHYSWTSDSFAHGSYAWFRPGQMIELMPHISNPEGRVHFAGEHASPLPGWMQGALISGCRTADEVNEAPA